jgi:Protein of unknown function (DUF2975)
MTDEIALRQIRRLSFPIMIVLSIVLGLVVLVQVPEIVAILFFFHGGGSWHASVAASGTGIGFSMPGHASDVMLEQLSLAQRSGVALLAALCAACGGLAVFHLRQLFSLYARGETFAAANIHHIKRFGLWLAASGIMTNVADRLFPVITVQPAHGFSNAAMAVVFGAMTWVVARVMELGRQADVERKEFV